MVFIVADDEFRGIDEVPINSISTKLACSTIAVTRFVLPEILLFLYPVGLGVVGRACAISSLFVVLSAVGDVIWADFDVFDEVLVSFA